MKFSWYRLFGSKFSKKKVYAKMPLNPDYIPFMKGKVTILKYKYDYDKEGNIIKNSERLVEIQSSYNKIVSWAKIPLSFLLAGQLWKYGNKWTDWGLNEQLVGDGRTRGLDGSGNLNANKIFQIPTAGIKVKNGSVISEMPYWYDNVNNQSAFPFFPTKILLGKNPETIGGNQQEKIISDDQCRLYSQVSNYENEYTYYERKNFENTISGDTFIFNNNKLRTYIYLARTPLSEFKKEGLWTFTSSTSPLGIYITKQNGYLSAISLKFVLPEHTGINNYCYDNVQLGQVMLKCDAGSRNLIDVIGIEENFNNPYFAQLDGIVYAIKNFGVVTKEANSKIVFLWTLYF